jgi:hypothetical protein
MKKILLALVLGLSATQLYAQAGDLTVGALGGYETHYDGGLYGVNLSYGLNQMMEVNLSGLYGNNLKEKDEFVPGYWKTKLYSANLDIRFLILNFEALAMGPAIGGQYLRANYTQSPAANDPSLRDYNAKGFNIGWHVRANLTDEIRLNGGWRYTSATESADYHFFYVGLGYAFNLF